MATRMLVDATHAEETRVVVVKGNRLEEFDYEAASKKQLKGNIYLAKVTRVEPSLQAAFVEYGGNRHGFLAFSEIHPDYYQIPQEDRDELLRQQMEATMPAPDLAEMAEDLDDTGADTDRETSEHPVANGADVNAPSNSDDDSEMSEALEDPNDEEGDAETDIGADADSETNENEDEDVEQLDSAEDDSDERPRYKDLSRQYRIQEVIKRRQILLIQVVKEERGNKGAALTTYLSLAGRYCVLMPNTARGGGISRKINKTDARKKLKSIVREMEVPRGMGVIVRTAGMNRTKTEIKRDYEYLLRLWDDIRIQTLQETAPALVYEEANLIKRSIRDVYSKDVDEILVEGDDGYRIAKDFMKQLIPSHAKRVQPYKDTIPLFHRYQVEGQLAAMHDATVGLKSGGYIVLNPTEALVAIDVNSGKSTKERNIEETALKTNLEAAEEIARQVRLRDLAGLVVIDFIDMEEASNNRAVERKMKDCLRTDRARIQLGQISAFGLMEMSRQRLRPSLVEASGMVCPHCNGSGVVRSTENIALQILRLIEEEGIRGRTTELTVFIPSEVALYVLNHKRERIKLIEQRYHFRVLIAADNTLSTDDSRFERVAGRPSDSEVEQTAAARPNVPRLMDTPEETIDDDTADDLDAEDVSATDDESEPKRRRRRRRRRRGGSERADTDSFNADAETDDGEDADTGNTADAVASPNSRDSDDQDEPRRRRRGRRGGRRGRPQYTSDKADTASDNPDTAAQSGAPAQSPAVTEIPITGDTMPVPAAGSAVAVASDTPLVADVASKAEATPEDAPRLPPAVTVAQETTAMAMMSAAAAELKQTEAQPSQEEAAQPEASKASKRTGWWARALRGGGD